MGNTVHGTKRFYATLDMSVLDKHDLRLLQNKKIEYVINHKHLGYCVRVYEHELDNIRETGTISLTSWPDGDSTTFTNQYKISGIFMETQTLEEI
jgi:hypothetical protein